MNGHAIAMGLFKKDAKKDTDKEAEKMVKKMGREAEGKVRMSIVSMNKENPFEGEDGEPGVRGQGELPLQPNFLPRDEEPLRCCRC